MSWWWIIHMVLHGLLVVTWLVVKTTNKAEKIIYTSVEFSGGHCVCPLLTPFFNLGPAVQKTWKFMKTELYAHVIYRGKMAWKNNQAGSSPNVNIDPAKLLDFSTTGVCASKRLLLHILVCFERSYRCEVSEWIKLCKLDRRSISIQLKLFALYGEGRLAPRFVNYQLISHNLHGSLFHIGFFWQRLCIKIAA